MSEPEPLLTFSIFALNAIPKLFGKYQLTSKLILEYYNTDFYHGQPPSKSLY